MLLSKPLGQASFPSRQGCLTAKEQNMATPKPSRLSVQRSQPLLRLAALALLLVSACGGPATTASPTATTAANQAGPTPAATTAPEATAGPQATTPVEPAEDLDG